MPTDQPAGTRGILSILGEAALICAASVLLVFLAATFGAPS